MQTRFYDSAKPGPPHGWLDGGRGITAQDRTVWENVIPFIRQTVRTLVSSVRESTPIQFWGGLQLGGRWWIYRGIPAEADRRSDRPGRTLAVIFCSEDKAGFDWVGISAVAPELETLASDPSHLALLLRRLDSPPTSASLTDDLLKQPSTPLLEALKSEMGRLLDVLGEGSHEYFSISGDGTVSNREREDISPKPSQRLKPTSETATPTAPVKKPQPDKPPLMKIFVSHVLFLVIGLLLGFGLHGRSSPNPPAEKPQKSQPILRSDDEAISHLRAATDYLEQSLGRRSEPLSPDRPQFQPQRRSSMPQNPPN